MWGARFTRRIFLELPIKEPGFENLGDFNISQGWGGSHEQGLSYSLASGKKEMRGAPKARFKGPARHSKRHVICFFGERKIVWKEGGIARYKSFAEE